MFFLAVLYMFFNKASIKRVLLSVFIYAIITGAFLFYAKLTFGTIFPNTTLGKATFSFGLMVFILNAFWKA